MKSQGKSLRICEELEWREIKEAASEAIPQATSGMVVNTGKQSTSATIIISKYWSRNCFTLMNKHTVFASQSCSSVEDTVNTIMGNINIQKLMKKKVYL